MTAADTSLETCSDFVVSYSEPASDASTDLSAYLRRDGGSLSGLQKSLKKGDTIIKKTCPEQFADRTALASCHVESPYQDDAGAKTVKTLDIYYYSIKKLSAGESEMKDCLGAGGDWKAVPRDSVEWRAAKVEQHQKTLNKMLGESSAE